MTCSFKVGDRVVWAHGHGDGNVLTVTELTARGFKYKLDRPVCIHPLIGSYDSGEIFDPSYYRLAEAVTEQQGKP
jgi:hypothetical protein